MLLDRSETDRTPTAKKTASLSEQIQSRALWRLRASLAETETFSDVVRMEHFASSPEVPSSMASMESAAPPSAANDWRAAPPPPPARADAALRAPAGCPPCDAAPPAPASVGLMSNSACMETRRQAFRRAIAQRWTEARIDGERRAAAQTSFDSMETDGDVSDTSCRPEMTTTSFDSTTTTTTDNTDDNAQAAARSPHDSGYRSVEVHFRILTDQHPLSSQFVQ